MNNVQIANETLRIIKEKQYEYKGVKVSLPDMDYSDVTVYSPEKGAQLVDERTDTDGDMCRIILTTEDSFEAASRYNDAMVMNFANAHNPGGGFRLGATAQEEALCRCSTLYESINSKKASEMYKYNNSHISQVESDYMLFSRVCVFRNKKCELLEEPFNTYVITIPAPNRIGAAMLASDKLINETMIRRIRIMLMIAKENGCKNLVLGAWGCGAFRNKPGDVASCFKKVIVDEGYGKYFDEICFAIYGNEDGKNYTEFKKVLGKI